MTSPLVSRRKIRRVALLTAGGLAPCLSSACGALIERFTEVDPAVEIVAYVCGYEGLLRGDHFVIGSAERQAAHLLHRLGGSPLGNSRVKLTNRKDAERRGLVKPGEDPLHVAAEQLRRDQVDCLVTIGGDDTNTTAADLVAFLNKKYAQSDDRIICLGLPKTVDNDIVPIAQTLGATTAAQQGALFARHVVSDHASSSGHIGSTQSGSLVINEVMGRASGFLTVATALAYESITAGEQFPADSTLFPHATKEIVSIHGVYIPEHAVDLQQEAARLKTVLEKTGCVNIFVSEGLGADAIVQDLQRRGKEVPRDAFGHVKLDAVNVGQWLGDRLKELTGARKVLVAKSGYFARAAPANEEDLRLIRSMANLLVTCAFDGRSGVIGHDLEDPHRRLTNIAFPRIKGHRPFDVSTPQYRALLARIGQQPPTSPSKL